MKWLNVSWEEITTKYWDIKWYHSSWWLSSWNYYWLYNKNWEAIIKWKENWSTNLYYNWDYKAGTTYDWFNVSWKITAETPTSSDSDDTVVTKWYIKNRKLGRKNCYWKSEKDNSDDSNTHRWWWIGVMCNPGDYVVWATYYRMGKNVDDEAIRIYCCTP